MNKENNSEYYTKSIETKWNKCSSCKLISFSNKGDSCPWCGNYFDSSDEIMY